MAVGLPMVTTFAVNYINNRNEKELEKISKNSEAVAPSTETVKII